MKTTHVSVLVAILLLGSCGGAQIKGPKCEVASLQVKIDASDRLNMDEDGSSLSLVVYLFQMKTAAAIKNADFEAMWRAPKEALGEDFLSMTELTLFPSQSELRELPLTPDARYVAIMGVFRKQTGSTWRAWEHIRATNPAECSINDEPVREFTFQVKDYRIETGDE